MNDILQDLEATGSADTRAEATTGDAMATSGTVVLGGPGGGDDDGFLNQAAAAARGAGGKSGGNALIVLAVLGVAGAGLWWFVKKRCN